MAVVAVFLPWAPPCPLPPPHRQDRCGLCCLIFFFLALFLSSSILGSSRLRGEPISRPDPQVMWVVVKVLRAERSSGLGKDLDGGQHLSQGKEVTVSPMKCYIPTLSIGHEVLLLRREPYFPALSQLACESTVVRLQRKQGSRCIFTIG